MVESDNQVLYLLMAFCDRACYRLARFAVGGIIAPGVPNMPGCAKACMLLLAKWEHFAVVAKHARRRLPAPAAQARQITHHHQPFWLLPRNVRYRAPMAMSPRPNLPPLRQISPTPASRFRRSLNLVSSPEGRKRNLRQARPSHRLSRKQNRHLPDPSNRLASLGKNRLRCQIKPVQPRRLPPSLVSRQSRYPARAAQRLKPSTATAQTVCGIISKHDVTTPRRKPSLGDWNGGDQP